MKKDIHPKLSQIKITCSCGNTFKTTSTLKKDLHIDVCDKCHPFYTGKQKIMDARGRVEQFHQRYGIPSAGKKDKQEKQEKTE